MYLFLLSLHEKSHISCGVLRYPFIFFNIFNSIGKWTLYSEPFFKVGTKKQLKPVVNFLGDGDIELARKRYNSFLVDMLS
jgi:hypothetical protein